MPCGELATSALGGLLHFWDVREGVAVGEISARRDITGGRRDKDLFDPRRSDVGKALTSLAYTADGACVLGGGQSKWVVLYDVAQRLLATRFPSLVDFVRKAPALPPPCLRAGPRAVRARGSPGR